MKLIFFIIAIVFVIGWSGWLIVNPDGYRTYLQNHPEMDKTGAWSDASDAKLRITGVLIIVAMLACGFIILKMIGVI